MNPAARRAAPSPADSELVVQIAAGRLEALGVLFDRHEPAVRRYLARLVRPSDVDDLVQATFLEVVRAAARFDPAFAARNWLFGIASVVARRHRRSIAHTFARLAAWTERLRGEPAPVRTPVEELEVDDRVRRTERALAALSPKKREVLLLVSIEGLSGEEVASALGIPINTVWTRLHHARRELRAALEVES